MSCSTCDSPVSAFSSSGSSGSPTLASHLSDFSDPHQTLSLVPKTHFGTGAPSSTVPDGYRAGDWYVDVSGPAIYCLRDTSSTSTPSLSWARAVPAVPSLSSYVTSSGLSTALSSYLTSSAAASTYATQASLASLQGTVNALSASVSALPTSSSVSSMLSQYALASSVASTYATRQSLTTGLASKQDSLVAGANVSISGNGTISVSVPAASASSPGLMSSSDKAFLDSIHGSGASTTLAGLIGMATSGTSTTSGGLMSRYDKSVLDGLVGAVEGKQTTLVAGTGISISGNSTISADVAFPAKTELLTDSWDTGSGGSWIHFGSGLSDRHVTWIRPNRAADSGGVVEYTIILSNTFAAAYAGVPRTFSVVFDLSWRTASDWTSSMKLRLVVSALSSQGYRVFSSSGSARHFDVPQTQAPAGSLVRFTFTEVAANAFLVEQSVLADVTSATVPSS